MTIPIRMTRCWGRGTRRRSWTVWPGRWSGRTERRPPVPPHRPHAPAPRRASKPDPAGRLGHPLRSPHLRQAQGEELIKAAGGASLRSFSAPVPDRSEQRKELLMARTHLRKTHPSAPAGPLPDHRRLSGCPTGRGGPGPLGPEPGGAGRPPGPATPRRSPWSRSSGTSKWTASTRAPGRPSPTPPTTTSVPPIGSPN